MASMHHFNMGLEIKTVLDLFCYQTEFPHMLTSTQKLTRLYRCMMRREKEYNFHQTKIDPQDYLKGLVICRSKIESIWDKPESSPEWNETVEYFRDRIRARMDPNMNIIDCKPYSMAQGRYYVWTDEQLSFDPFGYYANNRIIGEKKPDYGFFYYPAFPQDAVVHLFQPPTEYNDVPDEEPFKQ